MTTSKADRRFNQELIDVLAKSLDEVPLKIKEQVLAQFSGTETSDFYHGFLAGLGKAQYELQKKGKVPLIVRLGGLTAAAAHFLKESTTK